MTVIDVEAKCEMLGINPEANLSAEMKMMELAGGIWRNSEMGGFSHIEEWPQYFTQDEIVAYIRWNNLHKRFPDCFTWDGIITFQSSRLQE